MNNLDYKNIGVFLGCITRADDTLRAVFEEFMKRISIQYEMVGQRSCCGAPLILSGFMEDFKRNAQKIEKEIRETNVKELVVSCPYCYVFFKQGYAKLGINLSAKIIHISTFLKMLLDDGKLMFKKSYKRRVLYHDPCYLGRRGEGIYDEPREVLKSAGVTLLEFPLSKDKSTCCGGTRAMMDYLPQLYIEIAKEKIEMQAIPLHPEVITTACPSCYCNLVDASKEFDNIEIKHVLEIVIETMDNHCREEELIKRGKDARMD